MALINHWAAGVPRPRGVERATLSKLQESLASTYTEISPLSTNDLILYTIVSQCSPEFCPQMTGGLLPPGLVTVNVAILQTPTEDTGTPEGARTPLVDFPMGEGSTEGPGKFDVYGQKRLR